MKPQRLPTDPSRFWRSHLLWPMLVFISLYWVIEAAHLDLLMADWLYAMEGGSWSLKTNLVTSTILHTGGRKLVVFLLLLIILGALFSFWLDRLKPYRLKLLYLMVALPLPPLLVGYIKQLSHVDCPWNLLRYGGENPYLSLFQPHPGTFEYGQCFPSAHASGGYTLVALYFFFLQVKPEWRFRGLLVGLVTGLVFGLDQQLRGAHFISHDLTALAISWFCSLLVYAIWMRFLSVRAAESHVVIDAEEIIDQK